MDRRVDRPRPSLRALAALLPILFIGYLFFYPLGRMLVLALSGDGAGGVIALLGDRRMMGSAWFSLWQATVSTLLTVALALPLTWAISRHRFPGRRLIGALTTVPFVLPTVVVATAFVALGVEGSLWAILAAHVFYNVAVVVRTVGGAWSRLDPQLVESARVLGDAPLRAFLRVTLPLLGPALAAAASIVFLFSFTSFGVVLILGDLRYRTLEVEIYQQAVTFLDLPAAGGLALLQLLGIGVILAAYSRSQERRAVRMRLVAETANLTPLDRPVRRWSVGILVALTLTALAMPLAALVARSLGGGGWRFLLNPERLGISPIRAGLNSLAYAAATALIASTVGGVAAWVIARRPGPVGRGLDISLMLPLGTSGVIVGFGFLVALDRPVDLRASIFLIPLAHALVAVPFVVRAMVPTLRSIRPELREAAAVLGASPARVFREIDLPIAARGLLVGAGFAAAVSLGEFGATAFIARPNTVTLPFLIFRLLSRPGGASFGAAMAASVVLALVTAALILGIDRLRAGELGSF
jgi:thiamine transport system permease protein